MREDRDRGKMTVGQSFEKTLRALGSEPGPDLIADLSRRDAEFSRSHVRLCDDTVPFLTSGYGPAACGSPWCPIARTQRARSLTTWASSRWLTR